MPKRPTHVIESCALLGYLRGDPACDQLDAILDEPDSSVAVHKIVLLELFHDLTTVDGLEVANLAWERATGQFDVRDDLGDAFVKRVARWRRELGDMPVLAFSAALAEEHSAVLVVHADTPERGVLQREGAELIVLAEKPAPEPPDGDEPPIERGRAGSTEGLAGEIQPNAEGHDASERSKGTNSNTLGF